MHLALHRLYISSTLALDRLYIGYTVTLDRLCIGSTSAPDGLYRIYIDPLVGLDSDTIGGEHHSFRRA